MPNNWHATMWYECITRFVFHSASIASAHQANQNKDDIAHNQWNMKGNKLGLASNNN
jgi:hypothetical protein